jgi:hypothetical protein
MMHAPPVAGGCHLSDETRTPVLIRPVLAATAAAAMVVVPVTAAQAQTWRHADATGDVQSMPMVGDATTGTVEPDVTDPDVRTVRVSHGPRKVTMRVQFVDLAAAKDVGYIFGFQLRTNERLHRVVELDAGPGMWRGQVTFSSPRRELRCKGLSRSIDYVKNVVTVSVPRSCLSHPRWVQAGSAAAKITGLNLNDPSSIDNATAYVDDAGSDTIGNNLAWSPRIRKG